MVILLGSKPFTWIVLTLDLREGWQLLDQTQFPRVSQNLADVGQIAAHRRCCKVLCALLIHVLDECLKRSVCYTANVIFAEKGNDVAPIYLLLIRMKACPT